MTGDANEVRDLMPSLNRGGYQPTCVAAAAWLSNTPSGCFGEEASLVVRREVDELRPTLRSVIKHYYGAECSLEESAKALDISVGAAKSRLRRGRKTLRSYAKRHGVSGTRV